MHAALIVLMLGISSIGFVKALGEKLRPSMAFHWNNNSQTLSNNLSHPACQTSLLTPCSSSTDSIPIPTTSVDLSHVTHHIVVGAAGKLIFKPDSIEASIDDIIEFNFLSLNHTVTQSTIQQPCINNGAFDTGFNQFNPKNVSGKYLVQYHVETLEPQWFFCAQTDKKSHCEAGMVFGVNAASTVANMFTSTTFDIESTSTTAEALTTMEATGICPDFCSFPGSTASDLGSSQTLIDMVATAATVDATPTSSLVASTLRTTPINSTRIQNSTAPQIIPTISNGEVLEFSVIMAIFSVVVVEVTKLFIF